MTRAVYRLHDAAEQLLYVGSAGDPHGRLQQHLSAPAPFAPYVARMTVEWHASNDAATRAEHEAHYAEDPIFCRPNGTRGRAGVARQRSQPRELAYLATHGQPPIPTREQIIGGMRQPLAGHPRLLRTATAAEQLGIDPSRLNRWAQAGIVTPADRTLGGHARWDIDDLREQARAAGEHEAQ